jgi:HPt (histidine-containing phosphotransfer) domain-containing protein
MSEIKTSGETEVFDLEALKARCLNNLNLVDRVLIKFAVQVDADLVELEQAVHAGNASDAANMAHRIKGMTASIEARSMSQGADCCERTALAAATDQLPALLNRLREDRDRLLQTIAQSRPCSGQEIITATIPNAPSLSP